MTQDTDDEMVTTSGKRWNELVAAEKRLQLLEGAKVSETVTEAWLRSHGFALNHGEWYRNFEGFQIRIGYDLLTTHLLTRLSVLPVTGDSRIHCFRRPDFGEVRIVSVKLIALAFGESFEPRQDFPNED